VTTRLHELEQCVAHDVPGSAKAACANAERALQQLQRGDDLLTLLGGRQPHEVVRMVQRVVADLVTHCRSAPQAFGERLAFELTRDYEQGERDLLAAREREKAVEREIE
jgi:hypothetical protein